MRLVVISALIACSLVGDVLTAADLDKTSPAVRAAYDRAQAAVVKLLGDFQKAAQKEADRLNADLTKELKESMKRGDLDAANAINAKLEDIKSGAWLASVQRAWLDAGDSANLLSGALTASDIIGKWTITTTDGWNDTLIMREGGKITSVTDGDLTGTWTIAKSTVAIACSGDHSYVMSVTQQGVMTGKGGDVTATMKRVR
jgi:hypothetical protein